MSGFARDNIYKLQIGNEHRKRKFLCVEFVGLTGAPAVAAWVETEVPSEYDKEAREWSREHMDASEKVWVYSREVLEKKRITASDMAVYWTCDVLAKEAVMSTEAHPLVNLVLVEWFIKGPKVRSKVLREAAPEWWALITRKD